MTTAQGAPLRTRWPELLTLGVVLAVAGAHIQFIVEDVRLPRDLGLYYRSMPALFEALGGDAPIQAAWEAFWTSGGWYNLLLSLGFKVVGRTPHVLQSFDLFWVVAVLALIAAIAHRLGGSTAGLIAVALAGSFRIIVVEGRIAWIHLPELAMVLGVLLAWVHDPGLRRWRTVVFMGLCGALAMMLRPSGIAWVGSFVPLVAWRLRYPADRPRSSGLLIAWAVSLLISLRGIAPYLVAKLHARDRYVAVLPSLWEQVGGNLGLVAGGVAILGAAVCVLRHRRQEAVLILSWVVLTAIMFFVFRAGTNNFPAYGAALAILAGWGLARWKRTGVAAALGAFLLYQIPQWLPAQHPSEAYRWTLNTVRIPFQPSPENYYRPHRGVGAPEVIALIDASCPSEAMGCDILVDQGLFHPYGEDPSGGLERFVARLDHVRVWELSWPWRNLTRVGPAALAHFRCGQRDLGWRERFPKSLDNLLAAIQGYGLATASEIPWTRDCTLVWMTPGGKLLHPLEHRGDGGTQDGR